MKQIYVNQSITSLLLMLIFLSLNRDVLGKSINTDEAAAMGAVYHAADLGKGFKVKKFLIKDACHYPIVVSMSERSRVT